MILLFSQTACFIAGILMGMGLMCLLLAGKRIEMKIRKLQLDKYEQQLRGGTS